MPSFKRQREPKEIWKLKILGTVIFFHCSCFQASLKAQAHEHWDVVVDNVRQIFKVTVTQTWKADNGDAERRKDKLVLSLSSESKRNV